VIILATQIIEASSAAVKAGTACSKLNSTTTTGGYKYTCIKSGKKLMWGKGVKVQSPTTIPTPSASPTSKPTPTQSSKPPSNLPGKGRAGRYEYRYPDGVMQRKNIDGIWRFDDSRTNSNFDAIRVAAYESIHGEINPSQELKIQVRESIGENYPKDLAALIRLQIDEVSLRVSKYLPKLMPLDLVLVTEKDTAFVSNVVPSVIAKNYYGNNLENINTSDDYGTDGNMSF
jgi:hypothetical protein